MRLKGAKYKMTDRTLQNRPLNGRLCPMEFVIKKIKQMRSWAKRIENKGSLTVCNIANACVQIISLCASRLLMRLLKIENPRRLLSSEGFCVLAVIPLGFKTLIL